LFCAKQIHHVIFRKDESNQSRYRMINPHDKQSDRSRQQPKFVNGKTGCTQFLKGIVQHGYSWWRVRCRGEDAP
jgi:hypothetical protein